jgi:four helix bundle protein
MTERRYPKIEKFEDIVAWQEARVLTNMVYTFCRECVVNQDRDLARQLQRASVSTMSNIAEGFERGNPGDYARFLAIARGSCGEVRCQLYVLLDQKYISQSQFESLFYKVNQVNKLIQGLFNAVSRRRQS